MRVNNASTSRSFIAGYQCVHHDCNENSFNHVEAVAPPHFMPPIDTPANL
jgi:hypothetical protein